ncbi:MAG: glutathione S-transferase [Deltaproteobacteria bacterium]|nr:glutathione S-transferase [Deltaproteobacteria bacterium]
MRRDGHRLLTIGFSHFCEKARWALDRAGVPYREEPHLPVFHVLPTRRLSRRTSTPLLALADGRILQDSTEILRFADEHLAPGDRLFPEDGVAASAVAALEAELDDGLGVDARVIAYDALLPVLRRFSRDITRGVPRLERALLWPTAGLARALIRRGYAVTPENARAARARVDALFVRLAADLSDGRPFLTGDRFSAADLSFAALASPILNLGPRGPLLSPDRLPDPVRALIDGYRATPAGAYAVRLYAAHRAARVAAAP